MRLKWAIVVVAVCVVVTVAAVAYAAGKATADVPEVIRAQRFEVVDEKGSVLALLGSLPSPLGGAQLVLNDDRGKGRALLYVFTAGRWEGETNLILTDVRGQPRVKLRVSPEGSPGLNLNDENGHMRAVLAFGRTGDPALALLDEKSELIAGLPERPPPDPTRVRGPMGLTTPLGPRQGPPQQEEP